jgi:DNA-binding NtrC family response regulator
MPDVPTPSSRRRVLFVDDDEAVRVTGAALLEDHFEVAPARSGEEALVWLRDHAVDVICTDFQMVGMTGLDLLGRAAELHPHVSGILVTGHRDFLHAGGRAVDKLSYAVLLKPYAERELIERVERAAQLTAIKRSMSQRTSPAATSPEAGSDLRRTPAPNARASAMKRRP